MQKKEKRGTVFMTGSERRDQIINQIEKAVFRYLGAACKEFDVSRQVIVQDIALIRAADMRSYPQTGDIF